MRKHMKLQGWRKRLGGESYGMSYLVTSFAPCGGAEGTVIMGEGANPAPAVRRIP